MQSTIPRPRRAGISHTQVDGVPVFYREQPGPLRAALLFRVGQADEELAIRGISHLVEHLALAGTPFGPHAFNGGADSLFTTFAVSGDDDVVAHQLRTVCERFADLPVDQLDRAREVVRNEAARRVPRPAFRSLAARRWGATDHGLLGWDELGVAGVTGEQLRDWARCGFTRGNAALCLSAPPPAALRLPLGAPQFDFDLPVVAVRSSGGQCYTDSDHYVAFSYVAPAGAAADALAWIVTQRLTDRLCKELRICDRVQSTNDRLDATMHLYTFVAECRPNNATAVQRETADLLMRLSSMPVTATELATLRRLPAADDDAFGRVVRLAQQRLLGGPMRAALQGAAGLRTVTAEEIGTVAEAALTTLLLAAPDASGVPAPIATRARTWSERRLTGATHLPAKTHPDKRVTGLVRAEQGLSLLVGDSAVTVTYEAVAAMVCYDDGGRTLIDRSGAVIDVVPGEWEQGKAVLDDLNAGVPASRRVPGGARPAAAAPPAPTATASRAAARPAPPPPAAVEPAATTAVMKAASSDASDASVARASAPRRRRRPGRVRGVLRRIPRRPAIAVVAASAVAVTIGIAQASGSSSSSSGSSSSAAPAAASVLPTQQPKQPVAGTSAYHLVWSDARFQIDFPGKPDQATSPVSTSGMSLTMRAASWSSERRSLDVTAMVMPPGLPISGKTVPEAACKSGVQAAQGTQVTVGWAALGTYPVRETWYTVEGQRMVMRCFVAGRQFYTISGTPTEYQAAVRSFRPLR